MSTLPSGTPHMVHIPSHKAIERADTRHIVHRSGLKRLGFDEQQRQRIREIKAELAQCKMS